MGSDIVVQEGQDYGSGHYQVFASYEGEPLLVYESRVVSTSRMSGGRIREGYVVEEKKAHLLMLERKGLGSLVDGPVENLRFSSTDPLPFARSGASHISESRAKRFAHSVKEALTPSVVSLA